MYFGELIGKLETRTLSFFIQRMAKITLLLVIYVYIQQPLGAG